MAVIDEIQMIGNPHRGHSWTRALLGVQAREVHVCGSLEAMELVKSLAEKMGDDFELHTYERMTELVVSDQPLADYKNVRKGDCIVAFSRQDIFRIRESIERLTPFKCCVVYGQLPPETRSKQAHLFNNDDTGYDVLVASDAIGMGLNLNIRRVIFHRTQKIQDGNSLKKGQVEVSMMKQIAGRAGRKSSQYEFGEATCLQEEDMEWLHKSLAAPVKQVTHAGLFPAIEHMSEYAEKLDTLDREQPADTLLKNDVADEAEREAIEAKIRSRDLHTVLDQFMNSASFDRDKYFLCQHDDVGRLAAKLHKTVGSMPFSERFTFCLAPIKVSDRLAYTMLEQFATAWAANRPTALNVRFPKHAPTNVLDLTDLCVKHNIIDLYLWLSHR